MKVLVTGGAGFIGSHTVVALHEAGHDVVVVDNFSNSAPHVIERLRELTGAPVPVEVRDVHDVPGLITVMARHEVEAVIHFAAFKSIAESCEKPLDYFENNVGGTLAVLRAMRGVGCTRLVFSSSATVYGQPERNPVTEDAPLAPLNPYGRTKLMMEQAIGDVVAADGSLDAAILRYFNPIGAHSSALIGEDPEGPPSNLMPYLCQIGVGIRDRLLIYGDDYPTPDGTGVRDYIHVVDVADAHVAALEYLVREQRSITVNLGTGRGYSVLEVLDQFERTSGRKISYQIAPRRRGEAAAVWADPTRAHNLLGWHARYNLEEMCRDAWRWQESKAKAEGKKRKG